MWIEAMPCEKKLCVASAASRCLHVGLDQLCCLDRLAKSSCLLGRAKGHLQQECSWSVVGETG